ncbi:MAG: hypothetical protein CMP11_09565 [Zetaproteobacteria bacterium]|nr:hypothetical protein [Pseudobdellovibrionaceae bacterium]|tara:strand:- start:1738 stop:2088 length:351 start_codon:yes stop_codon:yes gene_type:complete
MINSKKTTDSAPQWASTLIDQLKEIEIFLGNIPREKNWQSDYAKKVLNKILNEERPVLTDAHTQTVFNKIVKDLSHEGYGPDNIANFINSGISYEGGPPYCNEAEVREALVLSNKP